MTGKVKRSDAVTVCLFLKLHSVVQRFHGNSSLSCRQTEKTFGREGRHSPALLHIIQSIKDLEII